MTALIILAAGESSRLGRPKQNLLFHEQTLLQRAIKTGLESDCRPVLVVLGANADAIELSNEDGVKVLYNMDWNEGMASSIRTAINEIKKNKEINQAIIMLCDQPFVTQVLIKTMLQKSSKTGKLIIACSYNNVIGVPALFKRELFAKLLLLKGHEGAKKLLKSGQYAITSIPFERGNFDIDTISDYEELLASGN